VHERAILYFCDEPSRNQLRPDEKYQVVISPIESIAAL
jgi:hypothetical protein